LGLLEIKDAVFPRGDTSLSAYLDLSLNGYWSGLVNKCLGEPRVSFIQLIGACKASIFRVFKADIPFGDIGDDIDKIESKFGFLEWIFLVYA